MTLLTLISNKLNIPLAIRKSFGPTTVLEYSGVILNSKNIQVHLPRDMVDRIMAMLQSFLSRQTSPIAKNFACMVIVPGRLILSHLLFVALSVCELHHYVHLEKICREDVHMWYLFLK